MVRRKLSDEERSFRKMGAGIPFSRWWPAAAILLAAIVVAASTSVVLECTGLDLESRHGPRKGALEMLLIYPCSPFLLRGGMAEWLWFALLWIPVPFAVMNWRWAGRHRKYWHEVQLREAERRKERRAAAKAEQRDG